MNLWLTAPLSDKCIHFLWGQVVKISKEKSGLRKYESLILWPGYFKCRVCRVKFKSLGRHKVAFWRHQVLRTAGLWLSNFPEEQRLLQSSLVTGRSNTPGAPTAQTRGWPVAQSVARVITGGSSSCNRSGCWTWLEDHAVNSKSHKHFKSLILKRIVKALR